MACILSLMYPECIGDCLLIPHNEQIPIYSDCNKQEIKGYAINDDKTDTFPIIGIFSIDGDMAFIEVDYLMGRPEYVNIEGKKITVKGGTLKCGILQMNSETNHHYSKVSQYTYKARPH